MNEKKRILIVVGTRPNFIKVTQFPVELSKYPQLEYKVVHTGQHFDEKMSTVFFDQFKLTPDVFLNITQGSPTRQMAEIMTGLEKVILDYKPDLLLVPGDVNSTLAAALAANKTGVKLAHLESGLRSFDRTMPEEFNRVLTDVMADYYFVTEQSGMDHLIKEGRKKEDIFFVGNTMIDTLVAFRKEIDDRNILSKLGVEPAGYVLMTMHRPATVDSKEGLEKLISLLKAVAVRFKVVFPIHPRTVNKLKDFGLYTMLSGESRVVLTEPLDYFSFQKLVKESRLILTDSGGIQEESTFLGIPCFTLRPNTERPITVTLGTNELVPFDVELILSKISEVESGTHKKGTIPPLWDGKATQRIAGVLSRILG